MKVSQDSRGKTRLIRCEIYFQTHDPLRNFLSDLWQMKVDGKSSDSDKVQHFTSSRRSLSSDSESDNREPEPGSSTSGLTEAGRRGRSVRQ